MASKALILAGVIEAILLMGTAIFLLQPGWLFRLKEQKLRSGGLMMGWGMLCLTFCWSFIFGVMLFLHDFKINIAFFMKHL